MMNAMFDKEKLNHWIYASDEEIENMSYQDMLECLEDCVYYSDGTLKGDCNLGPRKHWRKTILTCIDLIKEKIEANS